MLTGLDVSQWNNYTPPVVPPATPPTPVVDPPATGQGSAPSEPVPPLVPPVTSPTNTSPVVPPPSGGSGFWLWNIIKAIFRRLF